jgi:hypothetical protein
MHSNLGWRRMFQFELTSSPISKHVPAPLAEKLGETRPVHQATDQLTRDWECEAPDAKPADQGSAWLPMSRLAWAFGQDSFRAQ